jgi:hypothetical protein
LRACGIGETPACWQVGLKIVPPTLLDLIRCDGQVVLC